MNEEKRLDSEIIFSIASLIRNFEPGKRNKYYDKIFDLLKEIIDFKHSAIFLYNKEREKIELAARKGKEVDLIKLISFKLGSGFSAWVAQEKKSVLLNNLNKKKFQDDNNIYSSFLSIPLMIENELVGVINFAHEKKYAFDKEKIPALEIVATLLASVLLRFKSIDKIAEQNKKIKDMHEKLKKAQSKIVKMEKKTAVSATVASLKHEINNPLMVVQGYLSLMEGKNMEVDVGEKLEKIKVQIKKMAEILKKMEAVEDPQYKDCIDNSDDKLIDF